jgi:hypothetical protein
MPDKPRRHVRVRMPGDFIYPGLVLAWRRTADGTRWEAHIAVARTGSLLTSWMPAADLTPVRTNHPPATADARESLRLRGERPPR